MWLASVKSRGGDNDFWPSVRDPTVAERALPSIVKWKAHHSEENEEEKEEEEEEAEAEVEEEEEEVDAEKEARVREEEGRALRGIEEHASLAGEKRSWEKRVEKSPGEPWKVLPSPHVDRTFSSGFAVSLLYFKTSTLRTYTSYEQVPSNLNLFRSAIVPRPLRKEIATTNNK